MKEYNLGDKVTIKKDLCGGGEYKIHCSASMEYYRGKTFFIIKIYYGENKHYILGSEKNYDKPASYEEVRDCSWTSDMFEKVNGILDKIIKVKVLKVRRKI